MTDIKTKELHDRLRKVDEFDLLVACLRGETEGEPFIGKLAVACVIRNRVNSPKWPNTYKEVMLQPWQFSCFLPQYFREQTLRHEHSKMYYRECRLAAWAVYHNYVGDITNGATHYHAIGVHPKWIASMIKQDIEPPPLCVHHPSWRITPEYGSLAHFVMPDKTEIDGWCGDTGIWTGDSLGLGECICYSVPVDCTYVIRVQETVGRIGHHLFYRET